MAIDDKRIIFKLIWRKSRDNLKRREKKKKEISFNDFLVEWKQVEEKEKESLIQWPLSCKGDYYCSETCVNNNRLTKYMRAQKSK